MADQNGSFHWVEEPNGHNLSPVRHRKKSKKSKKLKFDGWGSTLLIEFLQSIGKDIEKKLSQREVTTIINDYVSFYKLFDPIKKKRVVSDDRLHALFSKNSFTKNKIYEMLDRHFAENKDSSEDDDFYDSEGDEDVNITHKKHKVPNLEKGDSSQKEKEKRLLSCFAAIIPENIKLLYLKKTLVQELFKDPESFEGKLLGSYIRVKSDPMDVFQKNSHQLHPVTGVKNMSGVHEVLFEVPNMPKEIPIRMLSDADFSNEEVEDLCQRVKDGLIKRPTVVEFEEKARVLHEDITKHWLPREINHLQNLIDRANEKGWRKELFEYLETKKRLQTPSEQTKLLAEVPTVTADPLEPEAIPEEQVAEASVAADDELVILDDEGDAEPVKNSGREEQLTSFQWVEAEQIPKTTSADNGLVVLDKCNVEPVKNSVREEHLTFQWVESEQIPKPTIAGKTFNVNNMSNVIDLCEEETNEHDLSQPKWFYRDPQGDTQGPFSGMQLKDWRDAGYFMPDFKVWKTPECAVLLTDILSGIRSN